MGLKENLITRAVNKVRSVAQKIGGFVASTHPVGQLFQSTVPAAQKYIQNNPNSRISTSMVGLQKGVESFVNRAPVQIAPKVQNPVFRMAAGIPESFINTPQSLVKGSYQGTNYINEQRLANKPINLIKAGAKYAPAAEGLLNIATLGTAGTVGKEAIKNLAKPTLKKVLLQAGKSGAKYGATYGGLSGLQQSEDATTSQAIKNVLKSGATNAILGAGMGVGLAGAGYVGGKAVRGYKAMTPAERQRGGIVIKGKEPVIPKSLEPLAQEAKKYKSAEEFVKAQGKNNPLLETAKDFENADDFISFYRGSSTQYGKYRPEIRKFGTTEESVRVPELGVDPEKKITIYRGIDTVQGGKMRGTINDGDFVTTDFDAANAYTGGKVVSKEVRAKDLILDYPEKSDFENPFYKGAEFIYSDSKNTLIKRSEADLKKIFDEAKSYNIKVPLSEWEKQGAYIQKNGKIPPNADLKGYSKSPEYNKYGTTERQRTSAYYEYVSNKIDEAIKTKSQLTDIYTQATKGVGGINQAIKQSVPVKMVQPELNTPKTSLQEQSSSLPIVSDRLKTAENLLSNERLNNQGSAEIAQNARGLFSNETIKDINLLKRVSKSEKFQVGDIETYRREYPQVTEKIVEAVRVDPRYANMTDSEALQVALELPTKQMIKVKRADSSEVNILTREQKLENKQWESEFGRPQTEAEANRVFSEWQHRLDDISNGITRGQGGSVSVERSWASKQKIKTKEYAVKEKLFNTQAAKENKVLYGDYGIKSTGKTEDNLLKMIKTSTNQGILEGSDLWKNKSRLALTNETMERNFTDIMGKDSPVLKDKLIEPIFKAEADRTKFLNKERADIKALGINPRSKESALVQQLGEGNITAKQVSQQSPKADKIIHAESVLRQKYDSYLEQLNRVLTRNGYDPIPKRKDYFHHFEDLKGIFEQVGVSIKATDLPTDINGLSADFRPGKSFFNAALQRKGAKTSEDAITGIDKYLEGASNQIYHTDNIQRLRAFETAIRDKYAGTDHLSNFVADLTEYTNHLAGKKSMVDRAVESIVGRRIYAGANVLKKQTGANMVGANVSSALTNFIPLTQTLATTDKLSVGQAGLGIIKNVFKDDGFIDKSNFLTSRIGSDRLSMTNWEKIGQGGNYLFKMIDGFTSQLAVRSKYLEGIKKGLSEGEAMKAADMWGRKTIAGRTAGEMPTLFNSKTLGFLTQFQLEVNNQVSFMSKDIPRNFSKLGAASALAQVFIYSYIYNNIYEKITGRRPAIDPIGLAQKTYEDYTNHNMKKGQATKNLVSNVSNQLPYASTFTGGRIPIGSAIPNPFAVIKGESTVGKELKKPLYYLLPPTGGGQVKKFIEGVSAFGKEASTTDAGNVRYPIPQTPANAVRTGLFGQYSTPEAQQYFREGRLPLGEKQSALFKETADKQGFYKNIIDERNAKGDLEAQKEEFKNTGGASQQVGGKIMYLNESNNVATLDLVKMDSIANLPTNNKYQTAIREKKQFTAAASLLDNDALSDEQKQAALQHLGIEPTKAKYYQTANDDTNLKTMYVLDSLKGATTKDDVIKTLATYREQVNGQMIASNAVLDNLVDEGYLTKAEATELKKYKLEANKLVPVKKATLKVKKPKKVTIKVKKLPKIKLKKTKITLVKTKKYKPIKFKIPRKLKVKKIAIKKLPKLKVA